MKKLFLGVTIFFSLNFAVYTQDDARIIFAETFDHLPDLKQSTVLNLWQFHQCNWTEASQSLVDLGDGHGKVWNSLYHANNAASYGDDGFAIEIPVGEFDELWFESDLWAAPDFDPYSVTGKYSGKMLFGFAAGNEYMYQGRWSLDSSATGNGWVAQGVWGSDYALRPYYFDQIADGQTHQLNANLVIPRGHWIHITRRVVMNTPGKKDGIFEVYINDSLRAQATDVEWRSLQQGANYARISNLHLSYFFGGSGADYASKSDNTIRIDNLVAYYYPSSSPYYVKGAAPKGHKIPRHVPSTDVYLPALLFDEVFTQPYGTIKSHYDCGVFSPTSMKVIKKEIVRSEGPIYIKFKAFNPGVNNHPTLNSYTRIYSGTGSSKSLLYTFNKENRPDGTYTIDNKEVTIEYFAGNSESKGFELFYTTPGAEVIVEPPPVVPPPVVPPPVTNNTPVISNQQFVIRQTEFSGNYVGRLSAFDSDAGQQLTFSFVSGNQSGLFSLDSQTGVLTTTKTDLFNFDLTEFNLVIKVTDNGTDPKNASANVNVQFIAASKVVYLNPKNTSDQSQDGSIEHPFDSWNDIAWKEGYAYLQMNGTTANVSNIIIGASNVTLGSYGEGEEAEITSSTDNYLISGFEKSNVYIKNLSLKASNAVSCVYFLGSTCSNIHVEHCTVEGYENSIKTVDCQSVYLQYNKISSLNEGVYSTAVQTDIYYNVFKNSRNSLNIVGTNSKANIFNNVFANNESAISATYAQVKIFNNIFYLQTGSQIAAEYNSVQLTSDNNIYYPEQNGFIKISGKLYNSLADLQKQANVDVHSFNSDPLFVNPENENFTVETYSPAINTGINLNLDKDYYGQAVPVAEITDIGIAEHNGKNSGEAIVPELVLYPNPSSGYVNIDADFTNTDFEAIFNSPDNADYTSEVKILDMNGKTIFSRIIENNNPLFHLNIELTGISKGIYSVILRIAEKTIASKLIIE